MEFKLKMQATNSFPREGIIIKSKSISFWLQEIQQMGLSLETIKVFPVPGTVANELYGCIVFFNAAVGTIKDIGKNNFCQLIEDKLFIPEHTTVLPKLVKEEWKTLFSEKYHLLHPEIGFVALEDELVWSDFLKRPNEVAVEVLEPRKSVAIPRMISSLRIEVDKEELLKEIENPLSEEERIEKLPFNLKKLMNGNNREMDKFLAYLEKNPEMAMKLGIPLDTIGSERGGNLANYFFSPGHESRLNFEWLGRFFNESSGGDSNGTGFFRYGFVLVFVILFRSCKGAELRDNFPSILVFIGVVIFVILMISFWSGFQRKSSNSGGGSALVDSARFSTLQSKYEKLAEDFVRRKEYEKAAHIYLKLLKRNDKAAIVLEEGKLYREAGAVYLKYLQNKKKAAECYEKGCVYKEALALYKELNEHEKVGDLYAILKNKEEADKNYYNVVGFYKTNYQYLKAALVCKNKIGNSTEAQDLLLEGWRSEKDASNCLNNYFATIKVEKLSDAITAVYKKEVTDKNKEKFLETLKHEFAKDKILEDITRSIAYEIVADRIDENPEIASQLIHFNKTNNSMVKDVMKFKWKKRNRTKD
ncbi:hypothetical protein SGQ83_00950 [Flavobacterium sp. Fl-318]|uniref:MoxR-vWA-beta-propeller ternary system domain-containing protein n=1 Tax=Flavobacterium cupriresistens TaxID=2893885 RepID=A0ABU4R5P6_9FLAO|nr:MULTISPECIES: hypothetical protein [unclassified Flavobacterium]MDX6187904.1 hypothetical protein [Flavobacterium sp. Fl-318]UFH42176.1 hypothetical protein LNP23_20500 [Flavobacterium sp. F-323]